MAINYRNIIKKWLIIPNIFSVGDELTPTLKIRRMNIQEKYKNMINNLYTGVD